MNQLALGRLAVLILLTACGTTLLPGVPVSTPSPSARTPTGPDQVATALPTALPTLAPTPLPFANQEPASTELVGTYSLQGSSPDGKEYSGRLDIALLPAGSDLTVKRADYSLTWDDGRTGAGILVRDAIDQDFLAASFGGSTCSAVVYSVFAYQSGSSSTFRLYGIRIEPQPYGIGSEIATPLQPRPYLEGDFSLTGTNADGNHYTGDLSISQHAATVWQLGWGVGLTTPGLGISVNKSLFAGSFGGEGCGIGVYTVHPDGSLDGTWAVWGGDQVGEEIAKK